jgi:ATP-binding cassette subfamily B protein
MANTAPDAPKGNPRALSGLLPFLRPYYGRIAVAFLFLVLAAAATLVFPVALRSLIDGGLSQADKGAQVMALREHFFALFGVAVALGLFSAARFYMVSWLGERVTADLRNAVYAHVLHQSPEFFETTQTGEVLSRLTTDTTLVQTVVGSSLSMGLRNAVMGIGAVGMLVWTNPYLMLQVGLIILLVVLPTMWFGRRVRKLSRASQDRVADSSAIAAEVLNAIPVVQSYTAEEREAARFDTSTDNAFKTAVKRSKARAALVAFIIIANAAFLLWGLFQGTQGGAGRYDHCRSSGPDGGVRDHSCRCGGCAGRGLWRSPARRWRHRALDGAVGQPVAHQVARQPGTGTQQQRGHSHCI